jgi:plastocyanin
MSRVIALCAALACALLAAGPARAAAPAPEPGTWDGVAGVQHLHFTTAPITVKPGQNSINNVIIPASQKPKEDGFIVRARPDLTYLDGTVPPVDVIHLHHGVWINASGRSPASPAGGLEPIFFGGEEKTVFRIPKGYGYSYKKTDGWILNEMIHNNTPNRTKVRLVWDLDFIPATSPLAASVTPVIPFWMDVRRGWGYPVFDVAQHSGGADGQLTFPDEAAADPYAGGPRQNEFSMPYDATIVAAVGHLHPGGLRDDIDVTRPSTAAAGAARLIFRSEAHYYDPAGPVSWDVSLTASKPDWRVAVKAGDVLGIHSTYDARQSSWYENMGIVLLFVAPNQSTGPDPFVTPVDPAGELTHGHLPENDHHGGKAITYPDARRAAAGATTTQVRIKDYQFRPGDLGLLYNKDVVPVVPRGSSLSFVNQDDPNVEWHSITTCRTPCNRQTGISYPLANGAAGTQFDSGQLGFGPVGGSPAANRLTWKTPSNLKQGTYTYFCRIHPFMRGAFRVR